MDRRMIIALNSQPRVNEKLSKYIISITMIYNFQANLPFRDFICKICELCNCSDIDWVCVPTVKIVLVELRHRIGIICKLSLTTLPKIRQNLCMIAVRIPLNCDEQTHSGNLIYDEMNTTDADGYNLNTLSCNLFWNVWNFKNSM